jgi:hypothetical protein
MASRTLGILKSLDQAGVRPIAVASHPRSGTHLCIDMLRLNFPDCHSWKLPFEGADHLYVDVDDRDPNLEAMTRVKRPLVKTHTLPGFVPLKPLWNDQTAIDADLADWLNHNATFLYPYRAGREAVRSLYQFLNTEAWGERMTFSKFLRQRVNGTSRARAWALHVRAWMEQCPDCCFAMERLLREPRKVICQIAKAVDLPWVDQDVSVPPAPKTQLMWRLARRASIFPNTTAIPGQAGPDAPGKWQEVFSEADREFFHQEAGDLLIQLGFEASDEWVTSRTTNEPQCRGDHRLLHRFSAVPVVSPVARF